MGATEGGPGYTMPRRPIQVATPSDVIELVKRGYCDSVAAELRAALDEREATRRRDVLITVREVYGSAAADALLEAVENPDRGVLAV